MDLDLLESFVAVAQELHFSKAAAKRHLSQSALSKQIQQLEGLLDTALFERNRHSVRITAAGTHLLEHAHVVLTAATDLQAAAQQLRRGERGTLRIGFTPTAPQHVLPDLIRRFRKRYSHVNCQLQELGSQAQLDALQQRSLDVGILRLPAPGSQGTMQFESLCEDLFVVAVPKEHPLAEKKRVALRSLAAQPWVLVQAEVSPIVYATIVSACKNAGFTPVIAQTVTQVHAALALVGSGFGVALVPTSARHTRPRGVKFIPLVERVTSVLALGYLSEDANPAVSAFVTLARGK